MTTELFIQFPTIKQGSQPTLTFVWPLASGMTPTNFAGATLSATMRHTATGNVTAVTGTLTVTDAATRTIAWALSDLDSGTAGVYQVTFGAVIGGVTLYTLFGRIAFEINPQISSPPNSPLLVGIPTLDAAWVAAARAQVPDGDDVATRAGAGTAGEVATIDASGNAVRSGMVAGTVTGGLGGALGSGSKTSAGFAGGNGARAVDSAENGIDAIQLGTGTNTSPGTFQVYGNQLLDASGNIPLARMSANLGTIAVQDANDVAITGGTISGIADLAIADGGTGASTASAALQNLEPVVTATVTADYTIDAANGSIFVLTLTGNYQLSFSNLAAGRVITVHLIQDGAGNRVPTWSGVTWGVTGAPTLLTGANDRNKFSFDSYNGTVIDGHLIEQYDN